MAPKSTSPEIHDSTSLPEDSRTDDAQALQHYRKKMGYRIGRSVVIVGATSFALKAMFGEEIMENIVDLLHSSYASGIAHVCVSKTKYEDGVLMLTEEGSDILSNLLADSFGYFLLDTSQIVFYLAQGRGLHLWKERVFHHVLQGFCNLTTLSLLPHRKAGRTVRGYLAFAYLFETSQIGLRLSNMVTSPKQKYYVYQLALFLFFTYRICNGTYAYSHTLRSGKVVPKIFFKGHVIGGAAAYLLNCFWFVKLMQRNKKYMLGPSQ